MVGASGGRPRTHSKKAAAALNLRARGARPEVLKIRTLPGLNSQARHAQGYRDIVRLRSLLYSE